MDLLSQCPIPALEFRKSEFKRMYVDFENPKKQFKSRKPNHSEQQCVEIHEPWHTNLEYKPSHPLSLKIW